MPSMNTPGESPQPLGQPESQLDTPGFSQYPRTWIVSLLRTTAIYWWITILAIYLLVVVIQTVFIITNQGFANLFNGNTLLTITMVIPVRNLVLEHWWAGLLILSGVSILVTVLARLRNLAIRDLERETTAVTLQSYFTSISQAETSLRKIVQEWEDGHEERLREIPTGLKLLHTLHIGNASASALSADGSTLACGSRTGEIALYNIETGNVLRILVGHTAEINCLAWQPNSQSLASGSADKTIRLWDNVTGTSRKIVDRFDGGIETIAWSPKEPILAVSGDVGKLFLFNEEGIATQTLVGHTRAVRALAWSPDGKQLASAGSDDSVRIWTVTNTPTAASSLDGETKEGNPKDSLALEGHTYTVRSLAWSPDGQLLVSGSDDGSIRIWNVTNGQCEHVIEELGDTVSGLTFSDDGSVLIAQSALSKDALTFWDATTWTLAASQRIYPYNVRLAKTLTNFFARALVLDHARALYHARALDLGLARALYHALDLELGLGLAFDRTLDRARALALDLGLGIAFDRTFAFQPVALNSLLLAVDDHEGEVALWSLDTQQLLSAVSGPVTHYTNAKVVLIGETGAGKTSLGMALMGEDFTPQPSTGKRNVWVLAEETKEVGPLVTEQREILLWDMAGQQGYRVVNQLHMDDVAVALFVFDNQDETGKSFGEVRYWERALSQAQQIRGEAARPQRRFLVAARADRGGAGVSQERIDRTLHELNLDKFFVTSAAENTGIESLREAILDAISWDDMLKITSSELFQNIKRFLIREKESGLILTTVDELYRVFLQSGIVERETDGLRQNFSNCIDRLATSGLIQRFDWGGYVLLQPELLDSFASALVIAARDEPDGLGSILKKDALSGNFHIPRDLRANVNSDTEKQLLLAMVEELIRRDLTLLQETEKGDCLVFPAQTTRERPEFPDPRGQIAQYDFGGPVLNIYATLAVRLSRSAVFGKPAIYQNAVQYEVETGGTCGLLLKNTGEGTASLTVFFGEETPDNIRVIFEGFVARHLESALNTHREPIFRCPNCGQMTVTPEQAQAIREHGRTSVNCIVCGAEIVLVESRERLKEQSHVIVSELVVEVEQARDREAKETVRRATRDYDVFFSYNVADERVVEHIARRLIDNDIMPWLFKWDEVKGHPFQQEIVDAIKDCKLAGAVLLGDAGPGPWQKKEIDTLEAKTTTQPQFNVIPVILPGTRATPKFPGFVANRSWVDFRQSGPDPLQELIRAISGPLPDDVRK